MFDFELFNYVILKNLFFIDYYFMFEVDIAAIWRSDDLLHIVSLSISQLSFTFTRNTC